MAEAEKNEVIPEKPWYQRTVEETFEKLSTNKNGLNSDDATERLKTYGYNELTFSKPSIFKRFMRQFNNPLVFILMAAAAVTGFLSYSGEDMLADTIVIISVVILNAILGFFQEGKAENTLYALQKMIVPQCMVVRDGTEKIIATRELVPGDIVVLEGGDRVPADLRLFSVTEAAADEAALTGESIPVEKTTEPIERDNIPPADQKCLAFSGTFLSRGHTRGIVVGTAEATEFGKIASLVKTTQTVTTPLQKKIAQFTTTLIIAISSVGVINFVLGKIFGYSYIYSFLASVSLVVAAIPEMLPMIVTAILALAGTVMAKRHALIRRLPAAETLGCTTVICSDKTGTLTKNQMTVGRIFSGGIDYELSGAGYEPKGVITASGKEIGKELPDAYKQTLVIGLNCNHASVAQKEGQHIVIGDPTEGALVVSAQKSGIFEEYEYEKITEIPFDSEKMYMASLHKVNGKRILFVKGSPEKVVALCKDQLGTNGSEKLQDGEILAKVSEMGRAALRVLAMGYKELPSDADEIDHADLEGITFTGIQGMIDPSRPEAIQAIAQCKTAGVRTVMITGDHVLTAKAIATDLGIIENIDAEALIGEQIATMSDEELENVVERISVYARVAPEHKLLICQKLQARGHIVSMTGDGVNDAPALKAADIGVAMGITGTEVSKEAASMVLTDDNFATIVNAVEEGRHAWNNLEKAILYTLPTNAGQAFLVMGAVLLAPFIAIFQARLPLEPVQILWVNLFDSVFLTMPLMMEPKEKNLLHIPPRDPKVKIANFLFMQRVILIGLAIAVPGFLIYNFFGAVAVGPAGEILDAHRLTQAQTAAFWAVLMVHFGFVMSARSVFRSAFTFSPFSNWWLIAGIVISILTRLLPTYVPAFSALFRTEEFPLEWWLYILPCLLPGFVVLEIDKLIRKKYREKRGISLS
ncbi:MAG: HAD-IC family P-type ATPase [Leptospirales bacterium]